MRSRSQFRRRATAVLVAVSTVLSGLAFFGLEGTLSSATGSTFSSSDRVTLAPAYVPGAGVVDLGALPASTTLTVAVAIASPGEAAMEAELVLESTPGTPQYDHPLSASQITQAYGPSPSIFERATKYFTGLGLAVRPTADRWMFLVSGPSDRVGTAFHTSFEKYREGARIFYSHPSPATLPSGFPWSGAVGLGNLSAPRPAIARSPGAVAPQAGCATGIPYAPCAIAAAYNLSSLYSAGKNGTGYRIGVVDTYDGSEPQSSLTSDLRSFTSAYGLSVGSVSYLYPVPTTRNLNLTSTGWGAEEALDLQWARAMAPGASIDMTFAPDAYASLYYSVDYLVAHQLVDVISLSWGEPDVGIYNSYNMPCSAACNASTDGSYTILHPVLVAAALEGISVFAATGDCGAAGGTDGVSTGYPASDPVVTGVGATDLTMKSGKYLSEVAWSGNASGSSSPGCQNQGGSGGGYSPFPRPYWQSAPGLPASPDVRGEPDVAIDGGVAVSVVLGGYPGGLAGTSVSTPIWAGIAAVADQVHGSRLGFLDPALYAIASGPNASAVFHDITQGSNGYSAHAGWDPVTGLGSPRVNALVSLLATSSWAPSGIVVDLRASPRYGAAPLTVRFNTSARGGATPYDGFDVDFGNENASWTSNGTTSYTYQTPGVYLARATVFDAGANSSVSSVVVIDVGGSALNVTLNLSTTSPAAGASVTFQANATGGTPPYRYSFSFGDGSFVPFGPAANVTHAFDAVGGYCVNVAATDAATPADASASTEVAVAVGGAGTPTCAVAPPLVLSFSSAVRVADLPGDLPFQYSVSGGAPPTTIRLNSDDPYVGACDCGIFHTPGSHTVTALAADSLDDQASAAISVYLYPELVGTFTATPSGAAAPVTVHFTAAISGGDAPNASRTAWTFGDGTATVPGFDVNHTYTSPGVYVARALLTDAANGSTGHLFVIDVPSTSDPRALAVSADLGPAPLPLGQAISFTATASQGAGAYQYRWDLGDNTSAYGATVDETYTPPGCGGIAACDLQAWLNVTDAAGATLNVSIPIPGALVGRSSALNLSDSVGPAAGTTPLLVHATASATGMPGSAVTWLFGDGGVAAGTDQNHTYLSPGNYTLSVIAADTAGDRLIRLHAVSVVGPARSSPTVSGGPRTAAGVAPFNATFNVSAAGGTGAPYSYQWAFGDGSSGSGPNVNHTYLRFGDYNATVLATDSSGDSVTATFPVVAYEPVQVSLRLTAPAQVTTGAQFLVNVSGVAACNRYSVPGCSIAGLQLIAEGGGVSLPYPVLDQGGNGSFVDRAPSVGGTLGIIVVIANTLNYTGNASITVQVVAPVGGGGSSSTPPSALLIGAVLLIVPFAAGGAIGLWFRRQRLRRQGPPPSP